jgi:hypothetical protein
MAIPAGWTVTSDKKGQIMSVVEETYAGKKGEVFQLSKGRIPYDPPFIQVLVAPLEDSGREYYVAYKETGHERRHFLDQTYSNFEEAKKTAITQAHQI